MVKFDGWDVAGRSVFIGLFTGAAAGFSSGDVSTGVSTGIGGIVGTALYQTGKYYYEKHQERDGAHSDRS